MKRGFPTPSVAVLQAGLGTFGYACAETLVDSPLRPFIRWWGFTDCDVIDEEGRNALSCHGYRACGGMRKTDRMASLLATQWGIPADLLHPLPGPGLVEQIPWQKLAGEVDAAVLAILAGLDDFTARLVLTQDARQANWDIERTLLVGGLGDGMASLEIYDAADREAPCVACGFNSLPSHTEPCTRLTEQGRLRVLRREAVACAVQAVRALEDIVLRGGRRHWLSTRSHIVLDPQPGRTWTRAVSRTHGCLGAHLDP